MRKKSEIDMRTLIITIAVIISVIVLVMILAGILTKQKLG